MFEVPSAKRVKRSQLFHSDDEDIDIHDSASRETKKALDGQAEDHEEQLNESPNYGFEYEFISPDLSTSITINSSANPQQEANTKFSESAIEEPEIYSFNLFAPTRPQKPITSSQPTTPVQNHDISSLPQPHKISIRSPSPRPETTKPGSLAIHRPESHYFTSALPLATLDSLRSSYLASAIDFSTLQILSKRPWPGVSHPQRLIALPSHRKQIIIHRQSNTPSTNTTLTPTTSSHQDTSAKIHHRARPSKKRRDLAKLKAQKRQVLIDETKTKEEHEREKRNKKNRERKLKRRAKERREKGEERGLVDGDGGGEGGAGSVERSIGGSEG